MIISDFDLLTSQQFSLSNPTNLIKNSQTNYAQPHIKTDNFTNTSSHQLLKTSKQLYRNCKTNNVSNAHISITYCIIYISYVHYKN